MSNPFSWRGNKGENFFSIPSRYWTSDDIHKWRECPLKMYLLLLRHANRYNTVEMDFTTAEMTAGLGGLFEERAQSAARKFLREHGAVETEPVRDHRGRIVAIRYFLLSGARFMPDGTVIPPGRMFPRPESTGEGRVARTVKSFTTAENASYYEKHFPGKCAGFSHNEVRCPFHDDRRPSMTLTFSKGFWCCHVCRDVDGRPLGGTPIDFEMRISNCDFPKALENIASITGISDILRNPPRGAVVRSHDYCSETGLFIFSIQKYQDGSYSTKPAGCGQKLLYRLPEVIGAKTILVFEGEKDCDSVSALKLLDADGQPIACTTNSHGAGNWQDSFARYFAGKTVRIMPDEDSTGEAHALAVRESIARTAASVAVLPFPLNALDEHGDASDYVERYGAEAFVALFGGLVQLPAQVTEKVCA